MLLLQSKDLAFSFKTNKNAKYKAMIENINSALRDQYLKEKKLAEDDPFEHICQK